MKNIYHFMAAAIIATCASTASARDDVGNYSIADAMASEEAKSILGDNIKFYFGNQEHGIVTREISQRSTNKKTNGVNKTNQGACEWAFLSAMKDLRDTAKSQGGNAVVNIRSNYRNNTTSSEETFKCGSGALMSGVALTGDIVVIN